MGVIFYKLIFHTKAAFKKAFLKIIYGKQIHFGKKTHFRRHFYLYIDKGGRVNIGDGCFFNNNVSINCLDSITIGKRCLFGENIKLYDQNHRFRDFSKPIAEQGFTTKPITIGDDCWICSNVTILQGVTIGDHSVIGAGCLILLDLQQRNNSSGRNDRRPQRNRRGLPDLQGCSAKHRCNSGRSYSNASN